MFESNHCYKVKHRRCGYLPPTTCIIRTIKLINYNNVWELEILKASDSNYSAGQKTQWYEDWCYDVKKIKDDSELLAILL